MSLKILVPVKRVVDHNVNIRLKPDGSGVDLTNVRMSMNPFDEIALEEALKLKEAGSAQSVHAVTIGGAQNQDVLRTALAMGADEASHVTVEGEVEPLAVAKILAAFAGKVEANLVLMGKQAIDDDFGQTGQMLAALLDWAQATFASQVVLADDALRVTREVDGGMQVVETPLPAIVTTDLRLNKPRRASLPATIKAKKMPIATLSADDLGVSTDPRLKVISTNPPPSRPQGTRVNSVAELVEIIGQKG